MTAPTPDRTPAGDLRDQLRAAIDDAGRHQVTIAADLGVTTKHLCAMLTGRARLTLEWAERIAEACGRQVVVAVVDPDSGLRERLAEALTREHYRRARERIEASPEEHCAAFADAVLPVVQDETAALRQRIEEVEDQRDQALAWQDTAERELRNAERRLDAAERIAAALEAERDKARAAVADEQRRADERRTELLEERDEALDALADAEKRAEEAERERDDYRQRFANQMTAATELTTTLREAERKLQQALEAIADERRGRLAAEAAVQRVRDLAEAANRDTAQLFARQFGGWPFPATLRADDVLAALDRPKETP